MKSIKLGWVLLAIVMAALLAACGGKETMSVSVEQAWGRPSPKVAENGAFYMLLKNNGDEADKLVGAKSPACGMIELHESFMDDQGVMQMRPVEGGAIEIPAGGSAELKVGGLHVMCMHKADEFAPGAKIPLTLQFENAGEMQLEVEIREP